MCVEADEIYIYLRDEYPAVPRDPAARDRRARGRPGCSTRRAHPPAPRRRGVHLRRGDRRCSRASRASAACRATSRRFPSQVGLFGRPTLIHNVETLYWVRDIVERGPGMVRRARAATAARACAAFRSRAGCKSPASSSRRPAITVRELIDEYCGGMRRGPHASRPICRAAPRAASCPRRLADIPLDFGTLEPHGCFIGSAAVVVLSDKDDDPATRRST